MYSVQCVCTTLILNIILWQDLQIVSLSHKISQVISFENDCAALEYDGDYKFLNNQVIL